jgi:hypothetical protein
MAENDSLSYSRLRAAFLAFGYERRNENGHEVFQHPKGDMVAVFPATDDNAEVRPVHRKVAETTVRDDGLVELMDFRFYLEHGKKREELIQRGDKLIWSASGRKVPVVAASTEEDGLVIINQNGAFSPCPVDQLTIVTKAST